MFAHILASFTEGEASSLGVLREHSALMRHRRPSFGGVQLEPRGGKCRWFHGLYSRVVLTKLRIPGTSTLCPLALGPGFYIMWGLFLEKQIRSSRWFYVRELRKPSTCLINISRFLPDSVQVFCCPESHFWILGWISDCDLRFQYHMPSSTSVFALKWSAYVRFPFQGRDCLITLYTSDTQWDVCQSYIPTVGPGAVGTGIWHGLRAWCPGEPS